MHNYTVHSKANKSAKCLFNAGISEHDFQTIMSKAQLYLAFLLVANVENQDLQFSLILFVIMQWIFHCISGWLSHSDLLQEISREVAQLASSADLQVAAFLISFLHHNLKYRVATD